MTEVKVDDSAATTECHVVAPRIARVRQNEDSKNLAHHTRQLLASIHSRQSMFASETSVAAPLACPLRALRRIAFGIALSLAALGQAAAADSIEAFVREGCPHCAAAEEFLAQLGKERPELSISIRDVQKDAAAMQRLQDLVREHGGAARVPAIYVGGQLIVGFSESANTGQLIRSALAGQRAANPSASAAADDGASCEADEHALECKRPAAAEAQFSVTLFGRTLTLADVGLPAFTLAMGLLDGFNPCSMWVLLLMISIIAPLNDRPRMLAIAGTFVLVEGIAYFVFMAAWLNLFLLIGISRPVTLLVAAIAIIAGLINLKDFVAFGQGISLSIPERAKPGIYQRMRGLLHAPTMGAAIAGAAILALLIQVVEFMCTSGFPALFTRILTLQQVDTAAYYGYMLLYIAAYMLDDIIVLGIGVALLSRHRLQEREGKVLKLLSGLVMIGLGVYLIADG
jgi:glutaredoxin